MSDEPIDIGLGQPVFDADGNELGTVRGITDDGIVVTNRTGMAALSIEHEHTPHELGEAELLWRCSQCGELGDIENMPERCPSCDSPKEDLYYWTED